MNDTTSFLLAFGSFWAGIAGYVLSLLIRLRRLEHAKR